MNLNQDSSMQKKQVLELKSRDFIETYEELSIKKNIELDKLWLKVMQIEDLTKRS